MAEYTGIILGAVALMYLLFETGFSLSTPGFIDNGMMDLMDFIKIGLLGLAFALGFVVIGIMQGIAVENSASQGFKDVVSLLFPIWGTVFAAFVFGMLIYYLWWMPMKLKKARLQAKKERIETGDEYA